VLTFPTPDPFEQPPEPLGHAVHVMVPAGSPVIV